MKWEIAFEKEKDREGQINRQILRKKRKHNK